MADKWDGKMLSGEDFVDLFSTEFIENTDFIKGAGRGNLNTNIATLRLPKAATIKKNDDHIAQLVFGRGRGRGSARMNAALSNQPARLPRQKGLQQGYLGIQNNTAFPSLPASTATVPRVTNPAETSHRLLQDTSDMDSSWPSLESYATSHFDDTPKSQTSYSDSVTRNITNMNTAKINGENIVVMRNIPEAILEEDLHELLSLYGNVTICNLERDTQGNSLRSALVRMETTAESEWIMSCFHGEEYPGCPGTEKLSCTLLVK